MPKRLTSVLESLIKIGRPPIIRRGGGLDSCILSTRVAIEVLGAFGIEASPLTVHVVVGNPAFARLEEDPRTPEDPDALRLLREKCGARFINLGGGDPSPGGWPHHLIAIIEGGHLFDLSIDQASKAGTDFEVHPELIPCGEDFLAGRFELRHIAIPGGCYLKYQSLPDETSYQQAQAWWDYQGLVERVIEAVP
ncbi:MAG: hypothetical protein WA746_13960 [Isosphaeraceae bacterium]